MANENDKFPTQHKLRTATLEAFRELGDKLNNDEIHEFIVKFLHLSDKEEILNDETGHKPPIKPRNKFRDYCATARTALGNKKILKSLGNREWEITEEGKQMLNREGGINEINRLFPDKTEESEEEWQKKIPLTTKNLILYGPPGTSKTYDAIFEAVRICIGDEEANQLKELGRAAIVEEYKDLSDRGRIEFVTFHQSFSYEEFVEGLRPTTESEDSANNQTTGGFKLEPNAGVFLRICNRAKRSTATENLDNSRQVFQCAVNFRWSPDDSIQKCLDNSRIQFEWVPDVDWTGTTSETLEEFKVEWESNVDQNMAKRTGSMRQTFDFIFGMKEGDYIILADGREKFVAVGEVTGPYYYNKDEPSAPHCREVDWFWMDTEGREREEIYPVHFIHHATYKLDSKRIDWDSLDQIVYEQSSTDEVQPPPNFVLIIDEINRANISKVFGELITLLEADKRIGAENEIRVRLPYSGKNFGVPQNLHIIGTMNTADRSIALLDTALRRRFKFIELMPDPALIPEVELGNATLQEIFIKINKRIEYLYDREHQIGHAYFMNCESESDVEDVFRNNVIPLLAEYFYEDRGKIARVLGDYSADDESPQDGCFFEAESIDPGKLGIDEQDSGSEPLLQWKVKSKFDFSKLK